MWSPADSIKQKYRDEHDGFNEWDPPDSVHHKPQPQPMAHRVQLGLPQHRSTNERVAARPILKSALKAEIVHAFPQRPSNTSLKEMVSPPKLGDFSDADETDFDELSWDEMEINQSRHSQQPRSHSRSRPARRSSIGENVSEKETKQYTRRGSMQRGSSKSDRQRSKSASRRGGRDQDGRDRRKEQSEGRDRSRGRGSEHKRDKPRARSKSRGPSRHQSLSVEPSPPMTTMPRRSSSAGMVVNPMISRSSRQLNPAEMAPVLPTRTISDHSRLTGQQPRRGSQSSTLKEFADQLKADIQRKQEQLEQIEAAALVVEGAEHFNSMRRDSSGFQLVDLEHEPRVFPPHICLQSPDCSNATSTTEETEEPTNRSRHYTRTTSRRCSLNASNHSSNHSHPKQTSFATTQISQGSYGSRSSFPNEVCAAYEMDQSDSSRSNSRREQMLNRRSQRLLLPEDNLNYDTDQSGDDDIISTQDSEAGPPQSRRGSTSCRSPKEGRSSSVSRRRSNSCGRRGGRSHSRSRSARTTRGKSASRRSARNGRTSNDAGSRRLGDRS